MKKTTSQTNTHLKLRSLMALLIVLLVAGYFYSSHMANTIVGPENKDVLQPKLLLQPQSANGPIHIDSATLLQPGFLVVRSVEGDRLGQVVEISDYLSEGTYKNISIPLGEFYAGGQELIVMVYQDVESDQTFNDLDQPYKKDGTITAVYVATGKAVPQSVASNTAVSADTSLMGMGTMEFVSYTDEGFEPKELSVTRGTMVHFVNESSLDMWVASDDHPAHTNLTTFDQFKASPPGEQYVYVFDQVGEWKYHDHLNPTAIGTIIVTN